MVTIQSGCFRNLQSYKAEVVLEISDLQSCCIPVSEGAEGSECVRNTGGASHCASPMTVNQDVLLLLLLLKEVGNARLGESD